MPYSHSVATAIAAALAAWWLIERGFGRRGGGRGGGRGGAAHPVGDLAPHPPARARWPGGPVPPGRGGR
jgi:hypothetical protein